MSDTTSYRERIMAIRPCCRLFPETARLAAAAIAGEADARIAELEKALPPADKLRLLADWFDADDRSKGRNPDHDGVQRDLRLWAFKIEAAADAGK